MKNSREVFMKRNLNLFNNFLVILFLSSTFLTLHTAAFAQVSKRNQGVSSQPITSLKCNEFTFDASSSYDPDKEEISFFWNFGDGNTSTQPVATHVYEKSGDYKVVLSIADNSGLECSVAKSTQTVRANIPPFAAFSADEFACVNQSIVLDAGDSYDDGRRKLAYEWDLGDGTLLKGKKRVTKSFVRGGKYKVTLTVDDKANTDCSRHTVEKVINVNEPPVAEAGEEQVFKCVSAEKDMTVSFDASGTRDANNDTLIYLWDFGDGHKDTGVKVTHKYSQLGNYDAKLIVKDNTNLECGTGVDFVTVKLNKAPEAHAGDDVTVCSGEDVLFDGTSSYAYKKGTLSAKWFFGDGKSAEGLKVSYRYKKPGQYQASVSIANELNTMCPPSRDTRTVTVNAAPSVSIKTVESVCLGNQVFFDATSASDPDGDALEYYWSFGDGTILHGGAKVAHDYKQGGNYRVSVIVDDGRGSACSTATAAATIKVNTPPVADIGPNLACCVGVATRFNASASSDPDGDHLTYSWDFGDGAKTNGVAVGHTYVKSGTYNITLTVDDNSGTSCSQSSSSFVAEVNTTPVPVFTIR